MAGAGGAPLFPKPEEQKVAQIAYAIIRRLERQPETVPSASYLQQPDVQAAIVQEVAAQYRPAQLAMEAVVVPPDIAEVVAKTTEFVAQQTISIPRILVVPTGEVKSGFSPFTLQLDTLRYPPVSEELWVQYLRTGRTETVALGRGGIEGERPEDYIVSGLVDFDDISYDDHADLLYDLAGQTVRHFLSYLSETDTRKVLRYHQREIARFIHAQMRYLFTGFRRCLYTEEKFQSDPERKLAITLDRDALKWFRPAKGQFQLYYRKGADPQEYQPDFVAEAADAIYMLESKRRSELGTDEVEAKKAVGVQWCHLASQHAVTNGGKPWHYVLIPHDVIAENMTLEVLVGQFGMKSRT